MMSLLETLLLYAFTIAMGVILARFLRREAMLKAALKPAGRGRRRKGRA